MEQIGKKIQEDLNGIYFQEVKIKQSLKVNNFESMYNSVKVDNKKAINIKPTALYLRLIAIAKRTLNIEDYFHYELTAYPMSLFKDVLMRKPNKTLLRNSLVTKKADVQENSEHVLDAGALLRTKFVGVVVPILEMFVNNTLSMLRINIPPVPLFLTDTVMRYLRKTMNTYEEV